LLNAGTENCTLGSKKDVQRRIKEHNTTEKCRYPRYRKSLILKDSEICGTYGQARRREIEVKRFSREKKLRIIQKSIFT
jgi:putative endonuclease